MPVSLRRFAARALACLAAFTLFPMAPVGAQVPPARDAAPAAAGASGRPFTIEKAATRYRFDADGRGTRETDLQVKVETELGVQHWGQLAFLYMPESQGFTVAVLEVRKVDGTVARPGSAAIADSAVQPGAGVNMLMDLRQAIITVPSLGTGDTLAMRLVWKTHTPVVAGHFWMEHAFTKDAVVLEERLEIDIPAALAPTIRLAPAAPAEASAMKGIVDGGRRVYRWTTSNLELPGKADDGEIDDSEEEEAPPADVRLSTFADWSGVLRWYDELASRALVVDGTVRAKALELTNGLTTDHERMQALYEFVSRNIRYVSLSFGLGRYAPHDAPDVLKNQYGDCKDKHTLLAALLKAVGIEAWPVLANFNRKVDPAMPSPGEFNHLITVVPRGKTQSEWLWLDTTPGFAPFGVLLQPLRDRDVLIVAPGSASRRDVVRTPADPPFVMTSLLEVTGTLDAIGATKAQVRYTTRSDDELVMRALLSSLPPEKWPEMAKALASDFGLGEEAQDFKVTNLEFPREPLTLEFTVKKTGSFRWTSTGATLSVPLRQIALPKSTEADWKKKTRARLGSPGRTTLRAVLQLPPGYSASVPVGVSLNRDGYAFTSSYRVEEGRIVAERTLAVKQREVRAESAAEYLSFVRAVRADEGQTFEFTFDTTRAPEIPANATASDLYAAGRAAYDSKRYDVAVTYWNAVAKLDPRDDSVWDALGLAYEQLKRPEDAIDAFRKQTGVNPYHKQAFKDLARVLQAQKQPAEARKALLKHVEITPLDGDALYDLGTLLYDGEEYAEASTYLERAAALKKTSAAAQAQLGKTYAKLKQSSKARASFERALELADTPVQHSVAAWVLSKEGLELSWAEELARKSLVQIGEKLNAKSLASMPRDQWDLVRRVGWSWDALGWAAYQNGDFSAAERYVKGASALLVRSEIIDELGQIYEKQGRRSDAAGAYLTAIGMGAKSPETRRRAQRAYGKQDLASLIDTAPTEDFTGRTAIVKPASPLAGTALLTVLLRPDGSVAEARFEDGPDEMRAIVPALQAAAFPLQFPEESIERLPVEVSIQCHKSPQSQCWAVLLPVTNSPRR